MLLYICSRKDLTKPRKQIISRHPKTIHGLNNICILKQAWDAIGLTLKIGFIWLLTIMDPRQNIFQFTYGNLIDIFAHQPWSYFCWKLTLSLSTDIVSCQWVLRASLCGDSDVSFRLVVIVLNKIRYLAAITYGPGLIYPVPALHCHDTWRESLRVVALPGWHSATWTRGEEEVECEHCEVLMVHIMLAEAAIAIRGGVWKRCWRDGHLISQANWGGLLSSTEDFQLTPASFGLANWIFPLNWPDFFHRNFRAIL